MVRVLLGFMGVGKTTVAAHLKQDYLDMDKLIEEQLGMSIKDCFAIHGESYFRDLESQLLAQLLAADKDSIISTGGGVVLREENRQLLRNNRQNNILLTASFDVLYERIAQDKASKRPLFLNRTKEEFKALFEERMALYEGLADTVILVDERTPEEIARMIQCQ